MPKIFISHSSKDLKLVEEVNRFLITNKIDKNGIFCSSIEGQGIINGQKISKTITSKIKEADLLIYIVTTNFIESNYCSNEIGAGAILEDKNIFLFKSNDVDFNDIKGFINSDFKFSSFDSNGLAELYDRLEKIFDVKNSFTSVNNSIKIFLDQTEKFTKDLVENKNKSDEEKQKKRIKFLESQYYDLPDGAKKIISDIYFSKIGVGYYSMSNGTVGLLQSQLFLNRVTTQSTDYLLFAYALNPWVRDFIKRNPKVKSEIEKFKNKKDYSEPNY